MPSLVSLLLHPDRRRPAPAPLRVDLRRVILGGMALWTLALLVALGVLLAGGASGRHVATCAAGVVLGAVGLVWERRNRSRYRGEPDDAEPSR